jgi:hypothetical protein
VEAGVFVLGMHRSGTSAATRLVNLLGVAAPREDDLVPASEKNPKGYWESMSLVAFNMRILAAVGSHMSCPIALEPGWSSDPRLDDLRREAPEAFRQVFPAAPWVWKDPRNCLVFEFWPSVLAVRPIVVLVARNPLEIVASSQRARSDQGKIYALALWERYLRQALRQIAGLPVFATDYDALLSAPLAWCGQVRTFLDHEGVTAHAPPERDVVAFVDAALRRVRFTRAEFLDDSDVSDAQRALFLAVEHLEGGHDEFSPPTLPAETPTTEALLAERRRTVQVKDELFRLLELERASRRWSKLRTSRYAAPARRVYATFRRRLMATPE